MNRRRSRLNDRHMSDHSRDQWALSFASGLGRSDPVDAVPNARQAQCLSVGSADRHPPSKFGGRNKWHEVFGKTRLVTAVAILAGGYLFAWGSLIAGAISPPEKTQQTHQCPYSPEACRNLGIYK